MRREARMTRKPEHGQPSKPRKRQPAPRQTDRVKLALWAAVASVATALPPILEQLRKLLELWLR